MPSARTLTERLRRLAPEAFAFGIIGAANAALYLAITYVAMPIGAVKATVIATVVTTKKPVWPSALQTRGSVAASR